MRPVARYCTARMRIEAVGLLWRAQVRNLFEMRAVPEADVARNMEAVLPVPQDRLWQGIKNQTDVAGRLSSIGTQMSLHPLIG